MLLRLRADNQKRHYCQKMRRRNRKSRMMMNREKPLAGLVVIVMGLMSSGFAATSARSGSMENVWRSLLLVPSISSSTSAHHAAVTRELASKISITYKTLLGVFTDPVNMLFFLDALVDSFYEVWDIGFVFMLSLCVFINSWNIVDWEKPKSFL